MDIRDEIRARLPIDQLVAQYCQLKRKGRNFVCLCPFHNDSHPSFLVSPDKGIAYCFACQSGGDIFSFMQKIEGVDFPTALKMLAEKAGVELPKEKMSLKPTVSKDEKVRLRECLEAAQAFYRKKLDAVSAASTYVRNRGVTDALINLFGIGYAPESFNETYEYLLKAGFTRGEIVASGLGIQKELEGRMYDRFRHRVMFPIHDAQGGLIGFGGRTMGDDDAKYVNSPESPIYHKSSVLFGLFQAREAIRKSRRVVLVEGYFDAVAAHKAGVQNVVAVSGTALTEEHVKILKRNADEVVLCLDQDNAGQLAAARAFDLLSSAQLKILSVTLPAKDPDELVQRDAALFKRLIEESAIPYVDAVIQRLGQRKDIAEPSGKRAVGEILFPLIAALPTSSELRAYIAKAAAAFGLVETEVQTDFRTWKSADRTAKPKAESAPAETPYSRSELCLGLALVHPPLRPFLVELIADDGPLQEIKDLLGKPETPAAVTELLALIDMPADRRERLQVLALYCEENFPAWSETLAQKEFRKLIVSANKELVLAKQMMLVTALKEARNSGKTEEEAKILTQYQQLLKLTKMATR